MVKAENVPQVLLTDPGFFRFAFGKIAMLKKGSTL